ncbi:MAG: hypothetical protein KBG73_01660 [Candidatus Promineofilum sp.]|jgi:hypothetical protein|nr:hypothetical protein [Promineifilum sp.]
MIDELLRLLAVAPVMGHVHPLWPLCLPPETEVVADARRVALEMDAVAPHPARPVLITELNHAYADRFLTVALDAPPPAEIVNDGLPRGLAAARSLLTHRRVAERITADVQARRYRCVILLLVDGLSYDDVRLWPEAPEPVFVDGPSITFARGADGGVLRDVGFPAIIGNPPLARHLGELGLARARGYSYWSRESNDVAAIMFDGMPLRRVGGLAEALALLGDEPLDGLYAQLVRIGTDGLAHGRREVSRAEVAATVAAVHADLRALAELLDRQKIAGAVYLTSDHGMLWRREHTLQLASYPSNHPRYAAGALPPDAPATPMTAAGQTLSLFHYPYLGLKLRVNDSGVHGGLSYWESLVPLVRIEVNV